MLQNIANNKAIITGASSGIGKSIAITLAKLGVNTVLVGRNNQRLLQVEKICKDLGTNSFAIACNLNNEKEISKLLEDSNRLLGGIDYVINNAGMACRKPVLEYCESDFDDVFAINVKVPIFMCKNAVQYLKNSSCATVINMCSSVSHKGYPEQGLYASSKFALRGFSQSFATEVQPLGIKVFVLSPGGVKTEMIGIARPDLNSDGLITTSDLTDIIEFMLTHRNSAVIDEIIVRRSENLPFGVV